MPDEPTNFDHKVFEWVAWFWSENGYSPTLREVMAGVGSASFRSVNASLNHLRQLGMLTWKEHASRTLRLVKDGVTGS